MAAVLILLLINVLVIGANKSQTSYTESSALVEELNLQTSNQLYYE